MLDAALALTLLAFGVGSVDQPTALGVSDEMRLFLKQNVDETATDYQRAQQLVEAIFRKDKLGFTYDRSRSKTAVETFRDASGNCLSFTNLFIALARGIGLDARIARPEPPL